MRKIIATGVLAFLAISGCRSEPSVDPSTAAYQNISSASPQELCDDDGPLIHLHGSLRSLSDLENEGLKFASRTPNVPQVPFAGANEAWQELKEAYRSGDTIRAAFTKGFEGRIHTTGYALSRDGCVVIYMHLSIAD